IRRVLRRLSAEVGRVARPLSIAVEIMARLDFITARARFSRDYAMAAPDLSSEGRLWLRQARHPLLEHLFRNEDRGSRIEDRGSVAAPNEGVDPQSSILDPRTVVPIDVRLGHKFNLLVITGPNTGGKTVTLKTTGLLCLMAQAGMHIPAADGSV